MKKSLLLSLVLITMHVLPTGLVAATDSGPQKTAENRPDDSVSTRKLNSARELFELFKVNGYQLDKVRKSKVTPQLIVTQIPNGLRKMEVHEKTGTFIRIMLPNVIKANEAITQERERLLAINSNIKDGKDFTPDEKAWLKILAKHYSAKPDDLASLLARVDTIPPSLAITQAIDESGWGTSHFAIEGNALFGEHLPAHSHGKFIEASGAKVKMAAFDTVLQATAAYMHNLNTSHAYSHLREKRSTMRNGNTTHTVDGHELANALKHYSEIGMEYVTTLHSIMHHYQLKEFDSVHLDKSDKELLIRFR